MDTLFESYMKILQNNNRWNPTKNYCIEHNFPDILKYPYSYNFIFELLFFDSNIHSLALNVAKYSKLVPEIRFSHTVSLYLLGIKIAEEIGFDRFNLPKWDSNYQRNFLHHWAAICLYHDIGYCIECNNPNFSPKDNMTINVLYHNLNLKYNISDVDKTGIIKRYYHYRIVSAKPKIDHGITAAMMLYDSLMKRNYEMQEIAKTAIMFYEKPMYGNENKDNILKYALAVAHHNMWFAYEANDIEKYNQLGMSDLIIKSDRSNRLSFSKEPLLFLLCLIDSIDPIKTYESSRLEDVLSQIELIVKNEKSKFTITFKDSINDKIKLKATDCEKWINISINIKTLNRFELTFDL